VLREGAQLLRRLHEPVQHGVRVHLEHPRGASDAHALSQTRDDPYDEVNRHTLTVKERAEALEKIAATGDTQQLPPGAAIGMTIGVEIAPAHPAAIGTVRVRAEVRRGVDLGAAPPRGHDAGWRSGRGLRMGGASVLTGVAVRLCEEACKRFRRTVALWR